MTGAILIDHPLIKHKLTLLRKKETPPAHFRIILKEISFLLAFEVTKGLELENIDIETPVSRTSAPQLSGRNMCIFSILRAGEGLAQGMLELIPSARVGHVGLYRDEDDLHAVEYY
ncbi:MAG: uracil phosphoribosyltransferase, partial [Gammaproteobacteria bacterium]|nr:uracil phosphoribosyltransferase [Gammaproteobacteria bacterium]